MTQHPCETSTLGVLYTIGYTACGCSRTLLEQLTAIVSLIEVGYALVPARPRGREAR